MSEVKPQEAFHTQTGEDAYGNDMWGSKGVNPDYVTFLEDSWNTRPSPKAQIAELLSDMRLRGYFDGGLMVQSIAKDMGIEIEDAQKFMNVFLAVCENDNP